jgi:hypothetical protein
MAKINEVISQRFYKSGLSSTWCSRDADANGLSRTGDNLFQ